jgi:hypothetical protein
MFVVDNSASMRWFREQMGRTVRVLARLLKSGKVDKEMELYYTSPPDTYVNTKAAKIQANINKCVFSSEDCDMFSCLDDVVTQALKRDKPVSIYVLTNGRWNAKSEDDLCKVDLIIRRILISIQNNGEQGNKLGIQFLRFYNNDAREDAVAKKRLDRLDDELEETFKELNVAKRDIVDVTDWDDDVRKMLLGGVFEDADDFKSPSSEKEMWG